MRRLRSRRRQVSLPAKRRWRILFPAAANDWLSTVAPFLRKRTVTGISQHIKQLAVFFGTHQLDRIHIGHVLEYQKLRQENMPPLWPSKAGASLINHELVTLRGVLERAGEWDKIGKFYRSLPLPPTRPPKVMSEVEEIRLFDVGARNPEWEIAYLAASLTLNTGAAGAELRNLRLEDVHVAAQRPWFRIDDATAKNEHRGRIVMLNPTACNAMARCLERAARKGSGRPPHFVFPFRVGPGVWDPTRPTTDAWLRRTFKEMAEAAGVPWLTPHCLRHQHITLSMESGEPIEQIMLRVGHVNPRMTLWYLSGREASQQAAVCAIDPAVRFGPKKAEPTQLPTGIKNNLA